MLLEQSTALRPSSLRVADRPSLLRQGGFAGPAPDPELLLRWIQNAIFHPRFCLHSWNDDGSVNELWMHPSVLREVKEAVQLRHRLAPYLYSLLFAHHLSAAPVLRPLLLEFPRDPACWAQDHDFMLGPGLLVASVIRPLSEAVTRTLRLPRVFSSTHRTPAPETDPAGWWFDVSSALLNAGPSRLLCGGSTASVDVSSLRVIPLFVPEGSILPMFVEQPLFANAAPFLPSDSPPARTLQCPPHFIVHVFPCLSAPRTVSFAVLLDDGESYRVLDGDYHELIVTCSVECDSKDPDPAHPTVLDGASPPSSPAHSSPLPLRTGPFSVSVSAELRAGPNARGVPPKPMVTAAVHLPEVSAVASAPRPTGSVTVHLVELAVRSSS